MPPGARASTATSSGRASVRRPVKPCSSLSFFKEKLSRNRQLSGYDCIKQKETGVGHEERIAAVTGAWKRSDSGKAFVNVLEDPGYVLARGRNETRLVLVDIYRHTTALPGCSTIPR